MWVIFRVEHTSFDKNICVHPPVFQYIYIKWVEEDNKSVLISHKLNNIDDQTSYIHINNYLIVTLI